MRELIPDLIVVAAKEFETHLKHDSNERILFSGKFGKGKTTFLQNFFKEQNRLLDEEKYYPIFLDPVNYSVASNEDIFRYIKYDIIFSLLEQNPEIDDIEFSFEEVAAYYVSQHPEEVIKPFIEFAPKIGKPLSKFVSIISKLHNKITSLKDSFNSQTETARLVRFLESFHIKEGSIYESDLITVLIQKILEREKGQKKSVLIIDNLDRIDPEHIFRILNVFSVHMDYHWQTGKENKFGFDKIVLVCDIQNIHNIFKNKYGSDVDFYGYINKFFSSEIFYFQNYREIENVTRRLLSELKIISYPREETLGALTGKYNHGLHNMLAAFVYNNIISLRHVFNFTSAPLTLANDEFAFEGQYRVELRKDTPVLEMMILSKILGGFQALYAAVLKLDQSSFRIKELDLLYKKLLFFDIRDIHQFKNFGNQTTIKIESESYQAELVSSGQEFTAFEIFKSQGGSIRDYFKPTPRDFYLLYSKILTELHNEKIID
jgi:hypothetical protein